MSHSNRPKVAVFKFASCDGCQLAILNLEDELLDIAKTLDLAYFLEARSAVSSGPYDIAFVEGSVTTEHDAKRIRQIRDESNFLVAFGACATTGGIQALRNWKDVGAFTRAVYASPEYIETLDQSTPIASHVRVDYELNGCPVSREQILELVVSLLIGRTPQIPAHPLCIDCKRSGNVCVMVARNMPCLGPVTHAGCGAICPSCARGCYGCFGPSETAKPEVLTNYLKQRGADTAELVRMLRLFTGYAQPMRATSEKLEATSS